MEPLLLTLRSLQPPQAFREVMTNPSAGGGHANGGHPGAAGDASPALDDAADSPQPAQQRRSGATVIPPSFVLVDPQAEAGRAEEAEREKERKEEEERRKRGGGAKM